MYIYISPKIKKYQIRLECDTISICSRGTAY